MKNKLIQTKDDAHVAETVLRDLVGSNGWKFLCEVLDDNMALLKKQLLEGMDGETLEAINRLRDKIMLHEELKGMPERMIRELSAEDEEVVEHDPYERSGATLDNKS